MSKFKTPREPLTVTFKGESYTYWIRELPYARRQELIRKAVINTSGQEETGVSLMSEVVLASVEEEDGTPAYTAEGWAQEFRDVVVELGKAAMKAQGFDMDEKKSKEPAPTPEEIEGNALPSRSSGTNSASPSVAPSQN